MEWQSIIDTEMVVYARLVEGCEAGEGGGHPDEVELGGLVHLVHSGQHQHMHNLVRVEEGVNFPRKPPGEQ